MAKGAPPPNIQTRRQLFDFLQGQMQTAYASLVEKKRLAFENTLIKSYLLEVNLPSEVKEVSQRDPAFNDFVSSVFTLPEKLRARTSIGAKEEEGLFEIGLTSRDTNITAQC